VRGRDPVLEARRAGLLEALSPRAPAVHAMVEATAPLERAGDGARAGRRAAMIRLFAWFGGASSLVALAFLLKGNWRGGIPYDLCALVCTGLTAHDWWLEHRADERGWAKLYEWIRRGDHLPRDPRDPDDPTIES
jgi:hypothetical protein